jgi:phosphatidate cytidylyltransferase
MILWVMSVLLQRVLSAAIGIPVLLYLTYRGGIFLLLAIFILMLLALAEFRNLSNKSHCKTLAIPLWLSALLFPVIYLVHYQFIINLLFFYLVFCYGYYLLNYPEYTPMDLAYTLFGAIYISWGFFHMVLLRQMTDGFWLILYVFLIVWSTDTGAYGIGTLFGKHKFAPVVSPKKSWEGVAGGLLVSILVAYLYTLFVPAFSDHEMRILLCMAPLVSLVGQLGDLLESSLKRFAEVKDSGQIIPGHGGILDRFDSLLLAVPFTYYLINMIERLL